MARSVVDPAWQLLAAGALLALAALICAPVASAAAADTAGAFLIDGENIRLTSDGTTTTTTADDVTLTNGRGARLTRITAARAQVVNKPAGMAEMTLTGNVHVEFRDAVLDADSAFAVFRGEDLVSVQVKGSQAQFSHQPKQSARRVHGRADLIEYTSAGSQVRFSGRTYWTDSRVECNAPFIIYSIEDGSASSPERSGCILLPAQHQDQQREPDSGRIPPPRTPDRSTAQ